MSKGGVQLVRRLAREHTDAAVKRIVQLMAVADRDSVSLAAAQTLLAYGHGKPGTAADNPEREFLRTLLASEASRLSPAEVIQFILGRIEAMQSYLEELARMTPDEQRVEIAQLAGPAA